MHGVKVEYAYLIFFFLKSLSLQDLPMTTFETFSVAVEEHMRY